MKSKPLKSEKDRVQKDSVHLWKPLLKKVPTLEDPKSVKKVVSPTEKSKVGSTKDVTDSDKK